MAQGWLFRYAFFPIITVCAYALYRTPFGLDVHRFFTRSDSSAPGPLTFDGFSNGKSSTSAGGLAQCVEGMIPVTASATNMNVTFKAPANNAAAAQLVKDIFAPNENFSMTTTAGTQQVSGTYKIFAKLCVPKGQSSPQSIHFLTHGGTLDYTYWDFATGYSYVDVAASRGYASFLYDRLGSGKSDHPDAIQVAQLPLQVEIAHVLVSGLKSKKYGGLKYQNVFGVGHSLGSALTQNVARLYPGDFAALLLTGYSAYGNAASIGVASTAQQIANTLASSSPQFKNIDNGYLAPAPVQQSVSFAFYQYPYYDNQIFQKQFATRQTNALGETVTLGGAFTPASSYSGPVAIMDGLEDFFFCGGNCQSPPGLLEGSLAAFFPEASKTGSQTATFPNTGHNVNLHLSAPKSFQTMMDYFKANGFQPKS